MKKFVFILVKKSFFSVQKIINLYFWSYFQRKKMTKKIAFFLPKAWVNPFGKMSFFRRWKIFVLIVKKSFFSIQNIIKPYFMFFFDGKQIKKTITCFDQKHGLIPLENCFFETLNNFVFIVKKTLFLVCFWPKKKLIKEKNIIV